MALVIPSKSVACRPPAQNRFGAASTAAGPTATTRCAPPRHFFIDVGNICNLRCPFCPTGMKIPGAARGMMSLEAFQLIFSKIKHVAEMLCLYNWGEPFLNKDLLGMCRIARDHGVRVHIDSNLSLRDFTAEEAEAIVQSGIDSIFASIDGATQKAYEKYRVGGNLARALRNLRQLSAAKTRCSSRTPTLAWAYCVHRFNEAEIDQAKTLAAELDVPIFFRLLSTHEETWRSWYHDHPDHPVLATPGWWTDIYPTAPAPDLAGIEWDPALPGVCKQPFSTMIVDWNGEVTPCCAVFGQHYRLGNLLEQDLEAVWNGEPLRSCRNFLLNYGKVRGTGSVCETLPCLVNV